MKITKTQLKQIIKEELEKTLDEAQWVGGKLRHDLPDPVAKDFFDGRSYPGGKKWPKGHASAAIRKISGLTWNAKDAGATKYSIWTTNPQKHNTAFLQDSMGKVEELVQQYNSMGAQLSDPQALAVKIDRGKRDEHGDEPLILTFYAEQ